MKALVIAEKPSVARDIARVLKCQKSLNGALEGDRYIVTWALGHLVTLADPEDYDKKYKEWKMEDLPMLPDTFRLEVIKQSAKQFQAVKAQLNRQDVDQVVIATDAGREGELVARLILKKTGCKKPLKRLWISSVTDKAIRDGFAHLKDGKDYEPLYDAAMSRAEADWMVGINATRALTCKYNAQLSCGRVQTPTLAMIARREEQIRQFVPKPYYGLSMRAEGVKFQWKDEKSHSAQSFDKERVQKLFDGLKGKEAVISSVKKAPKRTEAPLLYDLTELQREASRRYDYSAKETLNIMQRLYENHKVLTYPRTDSRYLTADILPTIKERIRACSIGPYKLLAGRLINQPLPAKPSFVNDKKVSDHHAIIPTMEVEKADIKALPLGERNLFLLVCYKLLCASAEPYVYEAVTATFDCGGYSFAAKGKRILSEGWREIDRIFHASLKEKPTDGNGGTLPDFTEGQTFDGAEVAVTEHFTQPPKPYTEDTLLSAMENAGKDDIPDEAERKGLGTPATRATIIEKLVAAGFVERKGKSLIPTKAGINLVTVLPESLTSPMLTAEWEQKLTEIAKGGADPDAFMDGICTMVQEIVSTYSCISEDGKKLFAPEKEVIGTCPRCGQPVYEGKNNFACSDRSCGFVLWKNDRFWTSRKKELTKKMAMDLLKKGRTNVKGMWTEKKQAAYDAAVILDDTGGKYINFKLEFPKRKEGVNGRK